MLQVNVEHIKNRLINFMLAVRLFNFPTSIHNKYALLIGDLCNKPHRELLLCALQLPRMYSKYEVSN